MYIRDASGQTVYAIGGPYDEDSELRLTCVVENGKNIAFKNTIKNFLKFHEIQRTSTSVAPISVCYHFSLKNDALCDSFVNCKRRACIALCCHCQSREKPRQSERMINQDALYQS